MTEIPADSRLEASRQPLPESAKAKLVAAAGIASLVLLLLVPQLGDMGLTWDEPWYFGSALRIQDWTTSVITGPDRAAALSGEAIREAWDWARYYNPHPPAYKISMAVTEALVGRWLGSVSGFRLASALWFSLLVGAVGWLGARFWGWFAGAGAALALLLMPRLLGHAHVAATDMPLTLFWFCGSVGIAAFLRRGGRMAGTLGAVGFGLGMATKFTGYLLPVPVVLWALTDRMARSRLMWGLIPAAAAAAIAYLLNPLAWYEPADYLAGLFRESLGREEAAPIATYYLGNRYPFSAPWHHAPVMTVATVPLGLTVLAGWGALRIGRAVRNDWLGALCLVQVLFFWVMMALPGSPTHDGVRLFLPLFPFLALLAGRGFSEMLTLVKARIGGRHGRLTVAVLSLAFFVPPLTQTLHARPYYLSYYSELIGGAGGAEVRGMEATYWYDALTPSFLKELNEVIPEGATLATFPSQDYFQYLQSLGKLRDDIEIRADLPADYLLLYARKSVFGPVQWGIHQEVTPVRAVTYQGVELVGLYAWTDPIGRSEEEEANEAGDGR